jgi:triosephosphate isomerase
MERAVRPLIGTSWKMHLTATEAGAYLDRLVPLVAGIDDRDLFVLPPYPAIVVARDRLTGTNVSWGAQDVHPDDWGPHTGDVSAPMLADLGARFVEVGHAERRRDYGETPALIAAKVAAVLRWGMTAVVCVGERRRTNPEQALAEVIPDLERIVGEVVTDDLGRIVIAYEPVWAIGASGEPADPGEVATVHGAIRRWFETRAPGGPRVRIIYGGSVAPGFAGDLLARPAIDGLFVGRAALDPVVFADIARTPIPEPAHDAP